MLIFFLKFILYDFTAVKVDSYRHRLVFSPVDTGILYLPCKIRQVGIMILRTAECFFLFFFWRIPGSRSEFKFLKIALNSEHMP